MGPSYGLPGQPPLAPQRGPFCTPIGGPVWTPIDRQDENGALKSIGLADPQRFVYQIVQRKPDQPDLIPHIETFDRDWVGGIVVLDASVVRNIVIKNIPHRVIEEIQNVPVSDNEEADEAPDLPIGGDE